MHLVVDVSFHGFGHLAQTAPVINALARRLPGAQLTVRSPMPLEALRLRIESAFAHCPLASDMGIPMLSALEVDVPATASAYRGFHADLAGQIDRYGAWLGSIGADAVLSNVAYVPLAAARRAGLPAAALSSFNWADIYAGVMSATPEVSAIHAQMVDCYRQADLFLLTEPGMPPGFDLESECLPPIAANTGPQREALRALLGAHPGQKIILVSLGGISTPLDLRHWPRRDDWLWLVPRADLPAGRRDMRAVESLEWNFLAVLCSVDALITKPGYGLYAEAAGAGLRVLSSDRAGWPETPHLISWLERKQRTRVVPSARLLRGDFAAELELLLAQTPLPAVALDGAERAALRLEALYQRRAR